MDFLHNFKILKVFPVSPVFAITAKTENNINPKFALFAYDPFKLNLSAYLERFTFHPPVNSENIYLGESHTKLASQQ